MKTITERISTVSNEMRYTPEMLALCELLMKYAEIRGTEAYTETLKTVKVKHEQLLKIVR